MSDTEWKELSDLHEDTLRFQELLEKTRKEYEHPENYNGPCLCRLCMSYADV